MISIPVKEPTLWVTAGSLSTVFPPYHTKGKKRDGNNKRCKTSRNPPVQ